MLNKEKILVIDDEQVIIDSISKIAGLMDLSVESTLVSGEAVKLISENEYSLIICDIMMPTIDGFQVLNEVSKRNIVTPVIMTTGYATFENAVKSLYEGANSFIPKPFTIEDMPSTIKRGIKHNEILKAEIAESIGENNSLVHYVTCPPKYLRLSCASWIKIEESGIVTCGITDLFLKTSGSLVNIELQNINENITQGKCFAKLFTEDQMEHSILSPISGKIIERNDKLTMKTSLLEKDPYFEGWLYKIIPSDLEKERKCLSPCTSNVY